MIDHRLLGIGRVRGEDQGRGEGHCGEDRSRDERRPPACPLEDQPACQQTEDRTGAGEAGPHTHGPIALGGGEHGRDRRQRARHDHRRADSHRDPTADERSRGLRGRGDERGEAEHDRADEQQRPSAEAVAECAEGQDERRQGDRVAIGDPCELRARRAEIEADPRQRQVEARNRRHDQHECETHRREDPVPAGLDGR